MHDELVKAASRLSGKGLLNRQGDALSMRLVGQGKMLFLEPGGVARSLALDDQGLGTAPSHARAYSLRRE
ncbi:MAG: hypothetical protein IBJ08_11315, partial [Pseudomonas sp.]|nr:hypothetical protein [Pseudomonas sp.]